jgi:UDP-N-acetylglucosamine 2-epimerase
MLRKNIIHIIGARPQFIKLGILLKQIKKKLNVKNLIIHTGQHYDYGMSKVFFKELNIPSPYVNFNLNKLLTPNQRLSQMIYKLEKSLLKIKKIDLVIIYGDTDTTLAGTLVARKLNLKIMHVESGLRSFDKTMPEEQNRIVADHLSDHLISPTLSATNNLFAEGINKKRIYQLGDVMKDSVDFYIKFLTKDNFKSFLKKNKILINKYAFFTLHRKENTKLLRLKKIIKEIGKLDYYFYWPLHPNIRKICKKNNIKFPQNLKVFKPVSYLESLLLIRSSDFVVTDSGGIQKESFFLGKKCFILRDRTEWKELLNFNSYLIDTNIFKISNFLKLKEKSYSANIFGNLSASLGISSLIRKILF